MAQNTRARASIVGASTLTALPLVVGCVIVAFEWWGCALAAGDSANPTDTPLSIFFTDTSAWGIHLAFLALAAGLLSLSAALSWWGGIGPGLLPATGALGLFGEFLMLMLGLAVTSWGDAYLALPMLVLPVLIAPSIFLTIVARQRSPRRRTRPRSLRPPPPPLRFPPPL